MRNYYFLLFVVCVITLTGCNSNQPIELKTTENGIQYHFFQQSDTAYLPVAGDLLLLELKYFTDNDSLIFKSGKGKRSFRTEKTTNYYKGSIDEGFAMMRIGDSALFIINADSFYKYTVHMPSPDFAKNGRKLKFYAKMLDIVPKQIMDAEKQKWEEQKQIDEKNALTLYILSENITTKPTESGIYIIEKKKGSSKKIKTGDKVEIQYAGYLLSGEMFESSYQRNKSFEFTAGDSTIIKGLNMGISYLSKGSHARLIIPSEFGYGARGQKPYIMPFSTLIFDIEVINVK